MLPQEQVSKKEEPEKITVSKKTVVKEDSKRITAMESAIGEAGKKNKEMPIVEPEDEKLKIKGAYNKVYEEIEKQYQEYLK